MAGSLEVSIVIWSQYITLKLFWALENDVIKKSDGVVNLFFYHECHVRMLII